MTLTAIAFMSYVRDDDKDGNLSKLCERLSDEVRMQTGEDFHIFQDRNDILWGQNWQERITASIDGATFLIPIITPSFFNSPACRDELQRFLLREKKLKRNDLILPIYYVDSPLLNDEARRADDKLAQAVASHQYADWRDLRFEPWTSPQVGKTLAGLAAQIREALERDSDRGSPSARIEGETEPNGGVPLAVPARPSRRRKRAAPSEEGAATRESPEETRAPSARTEPPTIIVDPMHRGHHITISEAIEAAEPGTRILVRPGFYQEGLVLDKPLELIGDGDPGEVVIQATGADALLFQTTMGRVVNLTLRQAGGGDWFGVDIAQGRLELEGCDITSESLVCVGIRGGADPRLRRNSIHDGRKGGVRISGEAQGTLEDNDIFDNQLSGVSISEAANPTLRRNRIHNQKESGVLVYDKGAGTIEDNEIFNNGLRGVAVKQGGHPSLRRNRIHHQEQAGVAVYDKGQGTFDDNDIFANKHAGVQILHGGSPVLRRNRITGNAYQGIRVHEGSSCVAEGNDLRGNSGGAWYIHPASEADVKRSGNIPE